MRSTEEINVNLDSAARHESGHIVAAAAQGLRLRAEGLMVDPSGWGLACYHKEPNESDQSRERIIIATLTGFKAENHFRAECSYPLRDEQAVIDSCDWNEARRLIPRFSDEYFQNENVGTILCKLEARSAQLVEQHLPAIEGLAAALLEKGWELRKPLKRGGSWSHENESMAKYVVGEEVVRVLQRYGIAAVCDPGP
jgi:hypothetical protein